jgi:hypothetical protein
MAMQAAIAEPAEAPRVPPPAAVDAAPSPAGEADEPPEVDEDLEHDAPEALTPPEIYVRTGDASERGPAPGPEPLIPPVLDLGEIELGRGARPTAEPLVPPEIVVGAEELEGPAPRR